MPLEGAHVLHTPWLKHFPWDKIKGGWRIRQAEFEWFEWRAARWVARHADEFDFIQICELPNLVYWLKKQGVKTPVVMRLTAPNYHDPRGGVSLADALIASGSSIERLKERGHATVTNIPNAVDADLFRPQPSDFRKRNGIAADEFVALYVARFQAFKNHAMLLDAFACFAKERPASRLVLVGSGPLRERTEQQAAELGIADRVLFLGEVPYREVPGVYAAADVMAISSDYESFCFAAIEAMATALPVLTTDCAWVPRLVADGAGEVVPVGEPRGLCRRPEAPRRQSRPSPAHGGRRPRSGPCSPHLARQRGQTVAIVPKAVAVRNRPRSNFPRRCLRRSTDGGLRGRGYCRKTGESGPLNRSRRGQHFRSMNSRYASAPGWSKISVHLQRDCVQYLRIRMIMTMTTPIPSDAEARKMRARERRGRIVAHRANNFAEAEDWDLAFWQSKTPQERLSAWVDIREDVDKVQQARRTYERNR